MNSVTLELICEYLSDRDVRSLECTSRDISTVLQTDHFYCLRSKSVLENRLDALPYPNMVPLPQVVGKWKSAYIYLSRRGIESNSVRLLADACVLGYAPVVSILLSDPSTDPTILDSLCLTEALCHNRIDVIKLLLADGRVMLDTSCYNVIDEIRRRPSLRTLLLSDARLEDAVREALSSDSDVRGW